MLESPCFQEAFYGTLLALAVWQIAKVVYRRAAQREWLAKQGKTQSAPYR